MNHVEPPHQFGACHEAECYIWSTGRLQTSTAGNPDDPADENSVVVARATLGNTVFGSQGI
jgi:hypothetical protein